jgi:hypothetical protein
LGSQESSPQQTNELVAEESVAQLAVVFQKNPMESLIQEIHDLWAAYREVDLFDNLTFVHDLKGVDDQQKRKGVGDRL